MGGAIGAMWDEGSALRFRPTEGHVCAILCTTEFHMRSMAALSSTLVAYTLLHEATTSWAIQIASPSGV